MAVNKDRFDDFESLVNLSFCLRVCVFACLRVCVFK